MKFNIEAIEAGLSSSKSEEDLRKIDEAELAIIFDATRAFNKLDHQYPHRSFLRIYDETMAAAWYAASVADKVATTDSMPGGAKTTARRAAASVRDAANDLFSEYGKMANRARCTSMPGDMPTDLDCTGVEEADDIITAVNFKKLVLKVMREAHSAQSISRHLQDEYGWLRWVFFDFGSMASNLLKKVARSIVAAFTGEIDPYVDRKTEEAIEKGRTAIEEETRKQKVAAWKYVVGGGLLALSVWGVVRAVKKSRQR